MRVHKTLGPGFLESAYGDALEIEFARAGIPYVREDEVRVVYDGHLLKTTYRADFTCCDRSYIVELKAIRSLSKIEWAQVIHYMRATKIRFAPLVNFGRSQLQYETFDLERLSTVSEQEINSDLSEPSLTLRLFGGLGACPQAKRSGALAEIRTHRSSLNKSRSPWKANACCEAQTILRSGTAERSETAEGRESPTARSLHFTSTAANEISARLAMSVSCTPTTTLLQANTSVHPRRTTSRRPPLNNQT